MTSERIPAPSDWAETELLRDDARPEQGQRPAVFEHAERDIAVHVGPAGPATGESRAWGVGLVFGDGEDVRDVDPVREDIEDRATAIRCARELMETLNREGLPESPSDVDRASLLSEE